MGRSISIIEYKVKQADFFLGQLEQAGLEIFAAQCFADAFTSSARSVTLSLQAIAKDLDGFVDWYSPRQELMRTDPLARFFKEYRNALTHLGDTAVRSGAFERHKDGDVVKYYFIPIEDVTNVPDIDVVTSCCSYFTTILTLIYDAFVEFRYVLDEQWYYTAENIEIRGMSLEDALVELGFPSNWLRVDTTTPESDVWRILRERHTMGCQINGIFEEYLGKRFIGPDE